MNESSSLIEKGVVKTRIALQKEKSKNKRFISILIWLLFSISIVSEVIFIHKLYKLYSTSEIPISLIIMYLSLSTVVFFSLLIMLLRHSKVKTDNPYYQYLFMVISTIIGFTFSTSFQEFLTEHEEKEDLIATLKPAMDYYNNLSRSLTVIDLTEADKESIPSPEYGRSTPEAFKDSLLKKSEIVKNSKEAMLDNTYNNPQNFKDLAPEIRDFLNSSFPLTTYYETLKKSDNLKHDPGYRALLYYMHYEILRVEVLYRKRMLQAEINRLNGNLTKKQFHNEIKRISEKVAKEKDIGDIVDKGRVINNYYTKSLPIPKPK